MKSNIQNEATASANFDKLSSKATPCFVYCGPNYGEPHHLLSWNGRTFTVQTLDGKHTFKAPQCDVEMPHTCDRCHQGYYISTTGFDGLCRTCAEREFTDNHPKTCPRCLNTITNDTCPDCKDREQHFPQTPAQKTILHRVIALRRHLEQYHKDHPHSYSCTAPETTITYQCLGRALHAATMCFDSRSERRSKIDLKIMRDANAILDAFESALNLK